MKKIKFAGKVFHGKWKAGTKAIKWKGCIITKISNWYDWKDKFLWWKTSFEMFFEVINFFEKLVKQLVLILLSPNQNLMFLNRENIFLFVLFCCCVFGVVFVLCVCFLWLKLSLNACIFAASCLFDPMIFV